MRKPQRPQSRRLLPHCKRISFIFRPRFLPLLELLFFLLEAFLKLASARSCAVLVLIVKRFHEIR
jgi:hypothetical protein